MASLIDITNQMWGRLYDLCSFTVERLDYEGNWLPEKYNQETEWDNEDLLDKIMEDGDWAEHDSEE